jgi:hypothetical protein
LMHAMRVRRIGTRDTRMPDELDRRDTPAL